MRHAALDAPQVEIGAMETVADARAFRTLNEEWIRGLFSLEPADLATIADPFGAFVAPGGAVLIARLDRAPVGCVALAAGGDGEFELSKMAVAPRAQNRGIGRALILAAIDRARELGASSIFLGSNTRLASAVHLYESVGFQHVPPEEIGSMPYERANVFMRLVL